MPGGITADFKVDIELVKARLKNLGEDMKQLTEVNRKAAKIVETERNIRVPVQTGHFRSASYTKASQNWAMVALKGTGRGSRDYVGVIEFGGTTARYHSEHRSHFRPWIGGAGGSSYYLYPALEAKREAITEQYREFAANVCRMNMP